MRPEEAIDALNVWASATQQQAGMSPQDVVGMLAGVLSGNSDGVAQQDAVENVANWSAAWIHGTPHHTNAQDLELLTTLSAAAATLLGQCMTPQRDWTKPRNAAGVNACAVLLGTLCRVVFHFDMRNAVLARLPDGVPASAHQQFASGLVPIFQQQGLLSALAGACTRAASVLHQMGSSAARCYAFSQFITCLMDTWNHILRICPQSSPVLHTLSDSSPVAPLLLPGAALAAAALQQYLGPDASAVFHSDGKHLGGYDMVNCATMLLSQQERDAYRQQYGWVLAAGAVAQALRVADSLSLCCYNYLSRHGYVAVRGVSFNTLAGQVLGSADVLGLVQVMLFLQARKLHDSQQGRAAAAAPRTSRSGRPKKNPKPTNQPDSRQPVQVPAHHDALADALGIQYLLLDARLYKAVTAPAPATLPPFKSVHLSMFAIDSVVNDAVTGLVATVTVGARAKAPSLLAASILSSANQGGQRPQQGMKVAAPLTYEMAQAVLLTVVELLLLGADDSQPHKISLDQLLVLMGLVLDKLQTSIGATRGKAALAAFTPGPSWVQDTSALDAPELHTLITPVMRDVVQLVTPLMLPTCHLVRLPSQQQQPAASSRGPHLPARIGRHPLGPGSLRSALFPEQIMVLAASAGEACLRGLLEEDPLNTTRALEAGLRADWAERSVEPLVRCSLLRRIPQLLGGLSMAADAADTSPSRLAAAISGSRQLSGQVHALLTTVAKFAVSLSDASVAAAAAAGGPAPAGTTNSGADNSTAVAASTSSSSSSRTPSAPTASGSKLLLGGLLGGQPGSGQKIFGPESRGASSPGQFRGSLELIGSSAGAAVKLGRAVCRAAGADSDTAAAPYVSLVGRCMCLVDAALSAAAAVPGMAKAELGSCVTVLQELISCLDWLQAEPACISLLDSSGSPACSTAAAAELHGALQRLLQELQLKSQEHKVVDELPEVEALGRAAADTLLGTGTGLPRKLLQGFGGSLCSFAAGVCSNPGCRSLSELSEIALVSASTGKAGRGKCSACGCCSYCSK